VKINIDIDCTPEEARTFMGLPDVQPIQAWMMEKMQERMSAGIGGMSMDDMLKLWMPAGMAGMDQLRDFYSRMAATARGE
jgi:hypothetical protein